MMTIEYKSEERINELLKELEDIKIKELSIEYILDQEVRRAHRGGSDNGCFHDYLGTLKTRYRFIVYELKEELKRQKV